MSTFFFSCSSNILLLLLLLYTKNVYFVNVIESRRRQQSIWTTLSTYMFCNWNHIIIKQSLNFKTTHSKVIEWVWLDPASSSLPWPGTALFILYIFPVSIKYLCNCILIWRSWFIFHRFLFSYQRNDINIKWFAFFLE